MDEKSFHPVTTTVLSEHLQPTVVDNQLLQQHMQWVDGFGDLTD